MNCHLWIKLYFIAWRICSIISIKKCDVWRIVRFQIKPNMHCNYARFCNFFTGFISAEKEICKLISNLHEGHCFKTVQYFPHTFIVKLVILWSLLPIKEPCLESHHYLFFSPCSCTLQQTNDICFLMYLLYSLSHHDLK